MPDGRTESYEAVPRRPEQQGTKGPALSMALCSLYAGGVLWTRAVRQKAQ